MPYLPLPGRMESPQATPTVSPQATPTVSPQATPQFAPAPRPGPPPLPGLYPPSAGEPEPAELWQRFVFELESSLGVTPAAAPTAQALPSPTPNPPQIPAPVLPRVDRNYSSPNSGPLGSFSNPIPPRYGSAEEVPKPYQYAPQRGRHEGYPGTPTPFPVQPMTQEEARFVQPWNRAYMQAWPNLEPNERLYLMPEGQRPLPRHIERSIQTL